MTDCILEKYKHLTSMFKQSHENPRKLRKYDKGYTWVKGQRKIEWSSGIPITMSDLQNIIEVQFPIMLDMNANAYIMTGSVERWQKLASAIAKNQSHFMEY